MALATITLAGPLITHANGSVSPGLPTNDVKKEDLPIPQGYDNDFNYQAPSFHLAILLPCLIPLAVYLLIYFISALWLIRWNKKVRRRLAAEESEDEVGSGTAPAPPAPPEPVLEPDSSETSHRDRFVMTPAGADVRSETVPHSASFAGLRTRFDFDHSDDDPWTGHIKEAEEVRQETHSWATPGDMSGETREVGATQTSTDEEGVYLPDPPLASLIGGRFEPSETFKHVISHIPGLVENKIPTASCQVFAVVGWSSEIAHSLPAHQPYGHYFLGLHFGRQRQYPEEPPYLARSHLMLRLRAPFDHALLYNNLFRFKFQDFSSENATFYTLEPDPANYWTAVWDFRPSNDSMQARSALVEDTEDQLRTGSATFRLMLSIGDAWHEAHEADGYDIGRTPIELGTVTFNRHWCFFLTRAPSAGELFLDYNELVRNIHAAERNTDLGFRLKWDDERNILTTAEP
ncbi:hypothetical protein V8F20_003512 [Naviculisporaceae sp. PSN 640]